jgi:hypothetical protein
MLVPVFYDTLKIVNSIKRYEHSGLNGVTIPEKSRVQSY